MERVEVTPARGGSSKLATSLWRKGPSGGTPVIARCLRGTLVSMRKSLDLTIVYSEPDEDGWIVAEVPGIPGALSQGHTRVEARENVVDALSEVLAYRLEASEAGGKQSEPLKLQIAAG